ncbi:MAG TPA: DUF1015 domain-containing protein [Verrucomicrobiales bacterium]|nr:DUF1015 domain-containing protein [Verrucomicrobiales bacterium]HIL70109.1 DUF1015 domain-containing protein [Verrucomicrobiota bacterium]
MAVIKPFSALRPDSIRAREICELPYDVLSSDEAGKIASGNSVSFFHVSKPEIDLDSGVDPYDAQVYAKGRENFDRLRKEGALVLDKKPCFYLYRQIMGEHSQVGLVALASCREYLDGSIRKHELTRPQKENDRVRHMEALQAQTGPVFLTFRSDDEIEAIFSDIQSSDPDIDFVADDGIRHTSWSICEVGNIDLILARFEGIPLLYIADGHHRSAAAARVWQSGKSPESSAFFLSVIFPHNQMRILPYNRVVKDLNGMDSDQFLDALRNDFEVIAQDKLELKAKHEVGVYLSGQWYLLKLKPGRVSGGNPADMLDVAILQNLVFEPLLGINDPRTDVRIDFVGGIRGDGELEKKVDEGSHACAFSLYPTRIEDLMEIADGGGMMPPKSTWFEPKLRDAMFSHVF